MKLFSIFTSRGRPAPEEVANDAAPDPAIRAAALFGVPVQHLTPEVRAAFAAMIGEIDSLRLDVDGLQHALAEAESSADRDALAPVYNRRAFIREAQRVVALVRRHEVEATMIYFDLNNFKQINDAHGHAAGDAVLRSVAETLLKQTRETDIVGRIGGDEFAVVLSHVNAEAGRAKAESLAAAICTERVLFNGIALYPSAAIGVAPFTAGEGAEQTLARADERMYQDKALHRRAQA